jgi:hypothetical protein
MVHYKERFKSNGDRTFLLAQSEWKMLIVVTLVSAIIPFKQSTVLRIFKEIAIQAVFIYFFQINKKSKHNCRK